MLIKKYPSKHNVWFKIPRKICRLRASRTNCTLHSQHVFPHRQFRNKSICVCLSVLTHFATPAQQIPFHLATVLAVQTDSYCCYGKGKWSSLPFCHNFASELGYIKTEIYSISGLPRTNLQHSARNKIYKTRIINETFICIMWYAFFWVIPPRLNFICRCSGTPCLFHLHRRVGMKTHLWIWKKQGIPKRRHIKFRRRRITQKKAYSIQNTAKFWNQERIIIIIVDRQV